MIVAATNITMYATLFAQQTSTAGYATSLVVVEGLLLSRCVRIVHAPHV